MLRVLQDYKDHVVNVDHWDPQDQRACRVPRGNVAYLATEAHQGSRVSAGLTVNQEHPVIKDHKVSSSCYFRLLFVIKLLMKNIKQHCCVNSHKL